MVRLYRNILFDQLQFDAHAACGQRPQDELMMNYAFFIYIKYYAYVITYLA